MPEAEETYGDQFGYQREPYTLSLRVSGGALAGVSKFVSRHAFLESFKDVTLAKQYLLLLKRGFEGAELAKGIWIWEVDSRLIVQCYRSSIRRDPFVDTCEKERRSMVSKIDKYTEVIILQEENFGMKTLHTKVRPHQMALSTC